MKKVIFISDHSSFNYYSYRFFVSSICLLRYQSNVFDIYCININRDSNISSELIFDVFNKDINYFHYNNLPNKDFFKDSICIIQIVESHKNLDDFISITGNNFKKILYMNNVYAISHSFKDLDHLASYSWDSSIVIGHSSYAYWQKIIGSHRVLRNLSSFYNFPPITSNFRSLSLSDKHYNVATINNSESFMMMNNIQLEFNKMYPHLRDVVKWIEIKQFGSEETESILKQATVFASFGNFEEMSMLLPEAMAFGAHLVGFSGVSDVAPHLDGSLATWSKYGDYKSVAKNIFNVFALYNKMVEDGQGDIISTQARNSYNFVLSNMLPEVISNRFVLVIKSVL